MHKIQRKVDKSRKYMVKAMQKKMIIGDNLLKTTDYKELLF